MSGGKGLGRDLIRLLGLLVLYLPRPLGRLVLLVLYLPEERVRLLKGLGVLGSAVLVVLVLLPLLLRLLKIL
jgi:hypothetical protein